MYVGKNENGAGLGELFQSAAQFTKTLSGRVPEKRSVALECCNQRNISKVLGASGGKKV